MKRRSGLAALATIAVRFRGCGMLVEQNPRPLGELAAGRRRQSSGRHPEGLGEIHSR